MAENRPQVQSAAAGPLAEQTDELAARTDWRSSLLGAILITLLIGLWLIGSAAAIEYDRSAIPIVCGAVVVVISILRLLQPLTSRSLALISVAAGALIVVIAFVASDTAGPTANLALMGAAVVVLSMIGLSATAEGSRTSRP